MGRYYEITVGPRSWSSRSNNGDNPGALNIQFDFFEYVYAIPMGNSTLTIEGIALNDLLQAQQFASQAIEVKAGMSAGLPLADPSQAGTILKGKIFQAFGNWIGTEMTLDFVVIPSIFTMANPGNFVLNWQPGTSLQEALSSTFANAYAKATPVPSPVFQLGATYTPPSTGVLHAVSSLSNLSKMVSSLTKSQSPTGAGVQISLLKTADTILVFDGSTPSSAKELKFTDLVGQPTWIDQNVMQFTTVLRADLGVGSFVKMPPGLQNLPGIVTTTAASFPAQLKYKTSFQGTFLIQSVRQIGNFRDPNGTSWVTVFQCVPQQGT